MNLTGSSELRALLDKIRILVEEHGRKTGPLAKMQQQRPWQSVSAFIFLRFIVPGILHPHLFGLCSGMLYIFSRTCLIRIG
jgi:hypothetical protein